jgi:hypothetical protein
MIAPLDMKQNAIASAFRERFELRFWIGDHQMRFQEAIGMAAHAPRERIAKCDRRHPVTIHHIEMNDIGPASHQLGHADGQTRQVKR